MVSVGQKPLFQKLGDRLGKFSTAPLLETDGSSEGSRSDDRGTWGRWGNLSIMILGASHGVVGRIGG